MLQMARGKGGGEGSVGNPQAMPTPARKPQTNELMPKKPDIDYEALAPILQGLMGEQSTSPLGTPTGSNVMSGGNIMPTTLSPVNPVSLRGRNAR